MNLFQQRWAIRVLASIAQQRGSRFAVLKHQLGVGSDSLSASLRWLMARDLVAKNSGYGHPLRPEYVLTEQGTLIAPAAIRFAGVGSEWENVIYLRWSVPTLVAVAGGLQRFNDIQDALDAVSPRALTQGLRKLTEHRLLNRTVVDGFPPYSGYSATEQGNIIAIAGRPLLEWASR